MILLSGTTIGAFNVEVDKAKSRWPACMFHVIYRHRHRPCHRPCRVQRFHRRIHRRSNRRSNRRSSSRLNATIRNVMNGVAIASFHFRHGATALKKATTTRNTKAAKKTAMTPVTALTSHHPPCSQIYVTVMGKKRLRDSRGIYIRSRTKDFFKWRKSKQ